MTRKGVEERGMGPDTNWELEMWVKVLGTRPSVKLLPTCHQAMLALVYAQLWTSWDTL
jgi:hypothetical protein